MSIPRLDCLPVELIHRICSYSERPEIRSLRRTSRVLSAVANEYFLDHVTIFYERGDMEMAESIVSRPSIAKNIPTLRFQADRLLQLHHYKQWDLFRKAMIKQKAVITGRLPSREEMARSNKMSRESRRQLLEAKRAVAMEVDKYSKDERTFAFDHYTQLLEDQNSLMDEHRAELCMLRLFRTCPKLDGVAVVMGNDEHGGIFQSWEKVEAFRNALIPPWQDDTSVRIGTRPVNEALVGSIESGRKLKSLTMCPINHHFFDPDNEGLEVAHEVIGDLEVIDIQIDQDWHKSKEDCAKICRMARKLIDEGKLPSDFNSKRSCNCGDESDDDEDEEETDDEAASRVMRSYENDRLVHFLSKAPKLQGLTFKGPAPSDSHPPLGLSRILGEIYWPHLSKLDLSQFTAEEQELSDLILRHATTLKHLALRHICIIGSWRGVMRKIGGKLPALESVRLRGYFVTDDHPFSLQYDPDIGSVEGSRRADGPEKFILTGKAEYFPSRW